MPGRYCVLPHGIAQQLQAGNVALPSGTGKDLPVPFRRAAAVVSVNIKRTLAGRAEDRRHRPAPRRRAGRADERQEAFTTYVVPAAISAAVGAAIDSGIMH